MRPPGTPENAATWRPAPHERTSVVSGCDDIGALIPRPSPWCGVFRGTVTARGPGSAQKALVGPVCPSGGRLDYRGPTIFQRLSARVEGLVNMPLISVI